MASEGEVEENLEKRWRVGSVRAIMRGMVRSTEALGCSVLASRRWSLHIPQTLVLDNDSGSC